LPFELFNINYSNKSLNYGVIDLKNKEASGAKVTTSILIYSKLKTMKTKLLLFGGIIIFFCSCSSTHKLGQTPDDVYYSPAPAQDEYVSTGSQNEMNSYGYNNSYNSYLSMNNNYSMYSDALSIGFGYANSPFYNYYGSPLFFPYNSFYSTFSPFISFYPYCNNYNSFYYPGYSGIYTSPGFYGSSVVYNTKSGNGLSNYSGPRRYNLAPYISPISTPLVRTVGQTARNTTVTGGNANTNSANSNSTGTGVGNFFRRVFSLPDNNNSLSANNRSNTRQNPNSDYYNNRNNNYNNRNNNFNNSNNNFNNTPNRSFQSNAGFSGRSFSGSSSSGGSAPAASFRRQ
jgi:hypothetical protein